MYVLLFRAKLSTACTYQLWLPVLFRYSPSLTRRRALDPRVPPPIVFLRCTDTSITCICVYWYSVYFIYIYRSALRTLSSVLTLIEYGKQCCVVPHTLLTCHLNRIRKIPTLRWGGSRGFRPTRLVTWVTAYGGYVLCNNQIHRQCR